MNRRSFFVGAAMLALLGPRAAYSQTQAIVDRVVADLRRQGYTDFEVRRTLLGRVIIEAEGPGRKREVVLNPHTGEILRDIPDDDDGLFGGSGEGNGSGGGSGNGSGGGSEDGEDHGGDKDDSDDDADDDAKDDAEDD